MMTPLELVRQMWQLDLWDVFTRRGFDEWNLFAIGINTTQLRVDSCDDSFCAFDSDEDAIIFVIQGAVEGERACQYALGVVRRTNVAEWALIETIAEAMSINLDGQAHELIHSSLL